MKAIFTPNTPVPVQVERLIVGSYLAAWVIAWTLAPAGILPGPLAAVRAVPELWFREGLGVELITSLTLNLQAVVIMTAVSLLVAYGTALPVLRPVAAFFSAARFNGFVGISLLLTLLIGDPHWIKVALLVIGMSVFTVPAVVACIEAIPQEEYDLGRTLNMNEWQVLWQVVIRGRLHEAIDVLRTNIAVGWMMLPMVEGLFRNDGGIGVLISVENKYFKMEAVYALIVIVAGLGLAQDLAVKSVKRILCPSAFINLERA